MCPPQVQAALSTVTGVDDVKIDYANKTAAVHVNKNVDVMELTKALESAGYGCTGVK